MEVLINKKETIVLHFLSIRDITKSLKNIIRDKIAMYVRKAVIKKKNKSKDNNTKE